MGQTSFPVNAILVTSAGLVGSSTGTGAGVMLTATQARSLLSVYTTAEVDTLLAGKSDTGHAHAASDITSGTIDTARLGSGTANASSYLRGDQTWATISGSAAWGGITGTLSDQTDLQTALDAKLALAGGTLTGGLSGTSASFTSLAVTGNSTLRAILPETHASYSIGTNVNRFASGFFSSTVVVGVIALNANVQLRANSTDILTLRNAADSAGGSLNALNGVFSGSLSVTGNASLSSFTATGAAWSSFTFATVPAASANTGRTIRITDRNQRSATSDGTNWNWAGTTTVIT